MGLTQGEIQPSGTNVGEATLKGEIANRVSKRWLDIRELVHERDIEVPGTDKHPRLAGLQVSKLRNQISKDFDWLVTVGKARDGRSVFRKL